MELIINLVVAALLAVMIGYCYVLNRRLGEWRNNSEEMARHINSLNQASARAQDSIHQLKALCLEAEHTLKMEAAKARALADELSLITEAGGDLADRIELAFDQQKARKSAQPVEPELKELPGEQPGEQDENDWLFREDPGFAEKTETASGNFFSKEGGPFSEAELGNSEPARHEKGGPARGVADLLSRLRSAR